MRLGSQSCPNSNCIQEPAEVILQKQQETAGILALCQARLVSSLTGKGQVATRFGVTQRLEGK